MGSQKVGHDWATEHLYTGFLQFYGFFSWIFFGFLFFFLLDFSCCSYSLLYRGLFVYFYLTLLFYFFPLLHLGCLLVCFFALFRSWQSSLAWFSGLCLSFVFNWSMSFLVPFAHQATLLHFLSFGSFGFLCVRVCVCSFGFVIICLILYLPFVRVHFLFLVLFHVCFCVFVLIPFIAITKGSWNLGSPAGLSGLSLGSGSAEPRALDCQRTPNPREY